MSVEERFRALPRMEEDSDWADVLVRAGVEETRRRRGRLTFALGLLVLAALFAATLLGTRLHRAAAAPPGPTHVQRQVRNGTVHWLFAHEPRGRSLAQAHIPLLSTVGAHWQPVQFARVIAPDPRGPVEVVLSLIGRRGRNICMTIYAPGGPSGGGCAVGLLLKPFNYVITSRLTASCTTCGTTVVAGVASDDVTRMTLFVPGGHTQVRLTDNVFVVTVGPSVSAWNLVAYDRHGLVIGRSSPPSSIPALLPSQTPSPSGGLALTQVVGAPAGHPLSATHLNVVAVRPGFRFAVGIRNGSVRRTLTVTATISGGTLRSPVVRRRTITLEPRTAATVRLDNLVGRILFAQRDTLKISLADAAHRESWVRTYPIIFALG